MIFLKKSLCDILLKKKQGRKSEVFDFVIGVHILLYFAAEFLNLLAQIRVVYGPYAYAQNSQSLLKPCSQSFNIIREFYLHFKQLVLTSCFEHLGLRLRTTSTCLKLGLKQLVTNQNIHQALSSYNIGIQRRF